MRRAPVLAALAAALAGCGYRTGSLVSSSYHTIAVPIFDNTTQRHDLEWALTQDVVEEIHARTPLRVVGVSDSPDLVLKGALVGADEDLLSRAEDERIRQSTYFLTAEVEVLDREGKPVVAKRRVTEREAFAPELGQNVRTAREAAGRTLAERIVRQLEQTW